MHIFRSCFTFSNRCQWWHTRLGNIVYEEWRVRSSGRTQFRSFASVECRLLSFHSSCFHGVPHLRNILCWLECILFSRMMTIGHWHWMFVWWLPAQTAVQQWSRDFKRARAPVRHHRRLVRATHIRRQPDVIKGTRSLQLAGCYACGFNVLTLWFQLIDARFLWCGLITISALQRMGK